MSAKLRPALRRSTPSWKNAACRSRPGHSATSGWLPPGAASYRPEPSPRPPPQSSRAPAGAWDTRSAVTVQGRSARRAGPQSPMVPAQVDDGWRHIRPTHTDRAADGWPSCGRCPHQVGAVRCGAPEHQSCRLTILQRRAASVLTQPAVGAV